MAKTRTESKPALTGILAEANKSRRPSGTRLFVERLPADLQLELRMTAEQIAQKPNGTYVLLDIGRVIQRRMEDLGMQPVSLVHVVRWLREEANKHRVK